MLENIPTYPLDTPAIRHLEIFPIKTEQGELLMVQDPLGILDGPAVMSPDPLFIMFLQMADGKTTLGEMAQKITMQTGQIIPVGLFEDMVRQLDEALLLQSERFVEAFKAKYEEFQNSDTRPYRTIRKVEGADRLQMLKDLGDEFRRHRMSPLSPPETIDLPANSVVGILAPHIDYQRGGEAYAWAYEALKQKGTGAKTFIILGTVHRPTSHMFIATRKHYDTPFGLLETDQELIDELEKEFDGELYRDEYIHVDEHTIELNATYLRHTFQGQDIKIVPILVGSLEMMYHEGGAPDQNEEVEKFTAALRTILERHDGKVALVGGVDFSHCGPEFGDEQLNDETRVKDIENGDRGALEKIEAMDAEGYFEYYRPHKNENKVCSISPIYTVIKTLAGKADAKILSYQQANSDEKDCLVSFSAVAFTRQGAEDKPESKIILLS